MTLGPKRCSGHVLQEHTDNVSTLSAIRVGMQTNCPWHSPATRVGTASCHLGVEKIQYLPATEKDSIQKHGESPRSLHYARRTFSIHHLTILFYLQFESAIRIYILKANVVIITMS
jgi:hypothetical protein